MRLPLPADAKPGGYLVVAIASDGDVSAQANLALRPRPAEASSAPPAQPGAGNMPGMFTMNGKHETPGIEKMPGMDARATAAPAEIRVNTTSQERLVMAGLVVWAALGGLLLLRGAPDSPRRIP